jgi:hypothetical protein
MREGKMNDNYCGNCGMDYEGMTADRLAEIVTRRGCPACEQHLAELRREESVAAMRGDGPAYVHTKE